MDSQRAHVKEEMWNQMLRGFNANLRSMDRILPGAR